MAIEFVDEDGRFRRFVLRNQMPEQERQGACTGCAFNTGTCSLSEKPYNNYDCDEHFMLIWKEVKEIQLDLLEQYG